MLCGTVSFFNRATDAWLLETFLERGSRWHITFVALHLTVRCPWATDTTWDVSCFLALGTLWCFLLCLVSHENSVICTAFSSHKMPVPAAPLFSLTVFCRTSMLFLLRCSSIEFFFYLVTLHIFNLSLCGGAGIFCQMSPFCFRIFFNLTYLILSSLESFLDSNVGIVEFRLFGIQFGSLYCFSFEGADSLWLLILPLTLFTGL